MELQYFLTNINIYVVLLAALAAAILEIDNYFVGMTLVSQPIFAGALIGFIFNGDIYTGVLMGAIVQLLWINAPPVGAYVPPSASAIAMSATVLASSMGQQIQADTKAPVLMFALISAAGIGYFVGLMDVWNRKFNTKIMHLFEDKIKAGRQSFVSMIQAAAITAKLLRDFLVYAVVFTVGVYLANAIYITLPDQIIDAFGYAFWAMPALGIAVVFDMFRTKTGEGLFAGVFALTYVIFSFRKPDVFLFLAAVLTASVFVVYNSVWGKKGKIV
ncbi:MAG: hypothetical protein CVV21_11605 [Candidatus Goldiibacteriota bacterium HGW-Goldbacteria-1]|jgi:PTS system mannose-specific IIC component|nr:MAG: hypothetical protein CVV21_11605 [Candidatus Goldiibacteriota bacterium HGW-Goldbacteria-1]